MHLFKNEHLHTLAYPIDASNMSQKNGLRCTVYSPSGNKYTGEWLDNKKHGEIPLNVGFCKITVKFAMKHTITIPALCFPDLIF